MDLDIKIPDTYTCKRDGAPCPIHSKEFIVWSNAIVAKIHDIDKKIEEDRKERNERLNSSIKLIDQERQERVRLETDMSALAVMHAELISVIKGTWANPGMIEKIKDVTQQISDVQGHLSLFETAVTMKSSNQKSFIAGVAFAGSIVGSVVGASIALLINFLKSS